MKYFFGGFFNLNREVEGLLGKMSKAISQMKQALPRMIKDTYYQEINKDKRSNDRFRSIARRLIEEEE